jgi:hypothetical protein|tara:strand:+ start:140 stop:457 length:318 start_codon:yes stop_codon:yes gene_type:complete
MSAYKDNYDKITWDRSGYSTATHARKKRVDGPYVQGDYAPYECPITGNIIDGKREHAQNLEKHGCRVHEKGEFEDVKKYGRQRHEEAIDRAIDKAAEAAAHEIDW